MPAGCTAGFSLLTALLLAAGLATSAQSGKAALKQQFEQERDPVRKARLAVRLGDEQWTEIRRTAAAGEYKEAYRLLGDYLDTIRTALNRLKASGRDAEKKPAGYKQLEIDVRRSIRELDQVMLAAPPNERGPLGATKNDMLALEKELVDLLFPRQPGRAPKERKLQ